jgi:predicted NAD-dependent protein-ADP-ribosyltransferase YbiA (DUF1768 family)
MEEMTEVDLDGKRYLWDGSNWCDAKTYMEPPEQIINRLNEQYRRHEVTSDRPSPMMRGRTPRARTPKARFVPAKAVAAPAPPPPKPVERLTLFEGEHAFLSNDSPATVHLDGQAFPSVTLAFNAAKALHDRLRPGMQREWDAASPGLMRRLLRSKFAHPQSRAALLATGDKHLSHTAEGADPFWHAPNGQGENTLGKLLMDLRAQLNKSYHLLRDEEIVEHLREYLPENPLVPDEALVKYPSWRRIEELYDLYKDELSPELMPALRARREALTKTP